MNVPDWWTFLLLALAAYRVWRLLAEDTILEQPRRMLVRLPRNWHENSPIPPTYRGTLAEFISCGWCLGFWVSLAWWGLWQQWDAGTLVVATPFAVSAVVGFLNRFETSE